MKKLLTLILCAVLVLGLFSGCGGNTDTPTEPPAPTQSPEEAAVFKVLMVGQSHAADTVWLLYDVLKAHMPEQEFIVGDVYQSSPISEHIQNIQSKNPAYEYFENTDGKVITYQGYTIEAALKKEQWDLIIFNEATWPQVDGASFVNGQVQWLTDYILETAKPGFQLAYNATWSQPVSAEVFSADRKQPPAGFRENLTNLYSGDRLKHFNRVCEVITTYVETDEDYDMVFHSGTAIQYASETAGVPEGDPEGNYDLYRDYTHLSDFGRLIVAYQLYAQIYGLEELTEVKVDVIPKHMRATAREQSFGDLELTETHKQAIMDSVNYALKNPNVAPPQTARETAILEPLD